MKQKHIAVLMGGWNSEREVSLRSGEAVYQTLLNLGYNQVTKIDYSRKIFEQLQEVKPDIVFNALHGQYGEDGRIQAILDILQIPYTHSGMEASVVGMDKIFTQKVCFDIGLKFPKHEILTKGDIAGNKKKLQSLGKPFVIKPLNEGSSVGVEVILRENEFHIDDYKWSHGDSVIAERYLSGQELNIAVLNGKALGVLEVRPKKLFYDYECKYTPGMTDYIMPAEIPAEKYQQAMELSEKVYDAVGCRGIARVEFILNNKNGGDNEIYLLEINTHPGFTATSIAPKIAKHAGISFEEIVESLIKTAKFC